MTTVVLVIHLMLAVALVAVVLMQRSEGGALGISSGGAGGFLTGRGTANLLTRVTAALALGFFVTSVTLTLLAKHNRAPTSLFGAQGKAPAGGPQVPGNSGQPSGQSEGTGILDQLKAGQGKAKVPIVPQSK